MEEQHPIEGLMVTAMNSIKQMIDVNTIIGDPIKALNNTVIIPISKVGFGFAAGGSEFTDETVNSYNKREKEENIKYRLPFGGGSGAGVNITPVAFLIVQNDTVKLLEANHSSVLDKLVEYVPDVIDKINNIFTKKMEQNEEESISDDDIDWDNESEIEDNNIYNDDYDDYTSDEIEEDYLDDFDMNKEENEISDIVEEKSNKKSKKDDNKKNKKETIKSKLEKAIKEDVFDEED